MNDEEIVERIVRGEIKLYEVEEFTGGDSFHATELRRRAIERLSGVKLENIGTFSIDANRATKANIENMIGVAQLPMGVAGPLHVRGEFADGHFFIPLATTEGALVASVNRGCTAVNKSGGARSFVLRDGMARGPVVKARSAEHAVHAARYVEANFERLKEIADATDPHITLLQIEPYVVGRNLFLRFVYSTGDAMGMNMATFATDEVLKFLERELDLEHVALSGNLCIDKKPSALNFIRGRGKTVISEVVLKREVVEDVLKTTPESMAEVCYRKCFVGSAQAAAYGFNAHFANIIAAMFIATGQDEAHTVEGSHGITTAEVTEDGDLYFAVTLTSLQVGTVGGGTALGTQREALSIMGVYGPGDPPGSNAKKFAEIIAAAVLAGEVSLIGALGARHLAEAHMRLNR
ncbi:MAG: Hydroxymethylglutaryl-CoA reductase [Candidatus Alkanophagales archaeon MCA70_species_2]|nr:Hydroxymethylglutaryl-CoA reductase [Candidatus Alkanophaga liquidiphilum]